MTKVVLPGRVDGQHVSKEGVGESGKLEGKEEKREKEGEIYGVPVPPSPTSTSLNCGTFSGACCCPGSACT